VNARLICITITAVVLCAVCWCGCSSCPACLVLQLPLLFAMRQSGLKHLLVANLMHPVCLASTDSALLLLV
jgi:hypothetical protein